MFTADGRYRLGREDDFSLPDYPVKERLDKWIADLRRMGVNDPETEKRLERVVSDPWHEKTICPLVGGDFNHDGNWYDLAVIVVDWALRAKIEPLFRSKIEPPQRLKSTPV